MSARTAHGADRAFGLAELAQQRAGGLDLGAFVPHARDDHAASLDVRVERLEVDAVAVARKRLEVGDHERGVVDWAAQFVRRASPRHR